MAHNFGELPYSEICDIQCEFIPLRRPVIFEALVYALENDYMLMCVLCNDAAENGEEMSYVSKSANMACFYSGPS